MTSASTPAASPAGPTGAPALHTVFNRRPVLAIVAVWTAVGLFLGSRRYLGELAAGANPVWWRTLGVWLTCYAVWAVLTPAILALARRHPLRAGVWARSVGVHAAASVAAALAYLLTTALVVPQLWWTQARRSTAQVFEHILLAQLHTEIITYWVVLGVVEVARHYGEQRERERQAERTRLRMAQLEATLASTRLDALRHQLQPHFLFNTLNTISVLMREDVEAAERMLACLAGLLRAALDLGTGHTVSLDQELALVDRYLDIERVRFGERLRVETSVEPATRTLPVPTFLLQTLVENAIRHAIAPRAARGHIHIAARRVAHGVELVVSDDGPGLRAEGSGAAGLGIGLANARARLEQLYPSGARMELESASGSGLTVRVTLPAVEVT